MTDLKTRLQRLGLEKALEMLDRLEYNKREILKLWIGFGDGYTYTDKEIGRIFKLSVSRISTIRAVAEKELTDLLDALEDEQK